MNWVTKNIFGFISDLMSGILNVYGSMIGNIFETVADANLSSSLITNASAFTAVFAIAFLAVTAEKQYLDVYVFQTAGDPDADPLDLIVRVAQALAVIGSSTWIFNELMAFSKIFTNDLLKSAHEDDVYEHFLRLIAEAADTVSEQSLGFLIAILLMLIGFIIFSVIAGIRGAELTLMKLLFPIFAVDLLTTNRERWKNFITTCVITVFGYSLQLILFKLCSMVFVQVDLGGGSAVKFATVIGYLVLMIRAPKWLEKFAYTTGISNTATSAARMAPILLLKK